MTLRWPDLLSKEDYEKVKEYMEGKGGLLPFSQLETYKPNACFILINGIRYWL
jgi:hypothetical protein